MPLPFKLSEFFSYRPPFLAVGDPISGSTDPTKGDVKFVDGTIITSIEGASNRTSAHLWGLTQWLANVIQQGHSDLGGHSLGDLDIKDSAAISEAKLALSLATVKRLDGVPYANTADVANEINRIAPYYATANALATENMARESAVRATSRSNGWLNAGVVPQGRQDRVVVANDEQYRLAGRVFHLRGHLSPANDCRVSLPAAATTAAYLTTQQVVWLEIYTHNVSATKVAFPYGCLAYGNQDQAATTDIPAAHTTATVPVDAPAYLTMLADPAHNLHVGVNGQVFQSVWVMRVAQTSYEDHPLGLTDPTITSLFGSAWQRNLKRDRGTFVSMDGTSVAQPMAIIVRRNQGGFHPFINPAGTALIRTGARILSINDCFDHTRLCYADSNGTVCPDYVAASYDYGTDSYTLNSTKYVRTGSSVTGKTAHATGGFHDVVNTADVDLIKPISYTADVLNDRFTNMLMANQLRAQLTPVFYGTVSNMHTAAYWEQRPRQALSVGTSEAAVFGTNNVGGVFIDQTNNGDSALVDGVRYQWSDKPTVSQIALRFNEGNNGSESHPVMLTYESISQTVSLNTTGLSGTPLLTLDAPALYWESGEPVALTAAWTGLGTSSAMAHMDPIAARAHAGQSCYMMVKLAYRIGGGVPFLLKNCTSARDAHGVDYPVVESTSLDSTFMYTGVVQSGNLTQVQLSGSASTSSGAYNGMYLVFTKSVGIPSGTQRRIISYDGPTRVAVFDQPLGAAPAANDGVTINRVPNNTSGMIVIDPYARAILGCVRRSTVNANSMGVAALGKPLISASSGTVKDVVVTGLAVGQMIDVIYYDSTPFTSSLTLWFRNDYSAHQYSELPTSGFCKFVDSGLYMATNAGSSNAGDRSYMGVIPTVHTPVIDGVTFVGIEGVANKIATTINEAKTQSWRTIVPFTGLSFDYGSLTTEVVLDDVPLGLSTESGVDTANAGMMMIASLVQDAAGYKLLVSFSYNSDLGYLDRSRLRVFDLTRYVGDTHDQEVM